jgi:hypothetical protein
MIVKEGEIINNNKDAMGRIDILILLEKYYIRSRNPNTAKIAYKT